MAASVVDIAQGFARRGIHRLRIKIFSEASDHDGIIALAANPLIAGINISAIQLRRAGIEDYERFARRTLAAVRHKPVSWDTCTNEFADIPRQARIIHSWGANAFVKVPVANTRGDGAYAVIRELAESGIKVKVTAVMTGEQVQRVAQCLCPATPAIVSVGAGRIADAGQDPSLTMMSARRALSGLPKADLMWGNVREVRNILEANAAGCDLVAVPYDILQKALRTVGSDLNTGTRELVRSFARDVAAAGYTL